MSEPGYAGRRLAGTVVAWLQWQLRGDVEAGKLFTGNPPGLALKEGWTVDKKNIP